ncbi:MAG TPA: hypothetical protein VJ352_09805 [Geodermatophilus sp.]|nr:hypothetical protein [Geodermatophilus sp.]
MAQYMILIYEDETAYATATPQVYGEILEEHNRIRRGRRGAGRDDRRR